MKLYLVQHGLAVDKSIDTDRPLSEQGKTDVERIANFLKQSDIAPAVFLHSGKTRARQSANILARILSSADTKQQDNINPNDSLTYVSDTISQSGKDTMIVGHLPFMQRLVSFLLNGNENTGYNFLPGSIVCLSRAEEGWSMDWMIRPDLFNA